MSIGTMFLIGVLLLAALVVAFVLFNRRAGGKIAFLGRAQLGKLGRAAEGADPVGQMRQAVEDASDKIGTAREALIRAEAAKKALERQVAADTNEVNVLTARINKKLDAGAEAASPEVAHLGEDLARAKKYLAANQAQLADNTALCNESLAIIKRENEKVADMARRADRLEVQLDVSRAQAAVADVADRMRPGTGLDQAAHAASRFEGIAMQQIDENNARLRVIRETSGASAEEEATGAEGQAALDEILKARGQTAA